MGTLVIIKLLQSNFQLLVRRLNNVINSTKFSIYHQFYNSFILFYFFVCFVLFFLWIFGFIVVRTVRKKRWIIRIQRCLINELINGAITQGKAWADDLIEVISRSQPINCCAFVSLISLLSFSRILLFFFLTHLLLLTAVSSTHHIPDPLNQSTQINKQSNKHKYQNDLAVN